MGGGGPTLVLHAGMPRTGTTSLQRALGEGGEALGRAGCEYPRRWRDGAPAAHHPLGREVWAQGASGPLAAELLASIGAGPATTIISSEELTNGLTVECFDALCEFLAAASERAQVRFVISVRRHDEAVASMYLRQLELDDPGPVGSYAWHRFSWIDDVFANLARLRESPELPTPVLVPYLEGRESTAPMLRAIGLDPSELPAPRREATSPGLKASSLLAAMDELDLRLDRPALARGLRSGEIELMEERHDFCILGAELRGDLHAHALESARRHGHHQYVRAFADADVDNGPRFELGASQLDAADLSAVNEYLAAAAARP